MNMSCESERTAAELRLLSRKSNGKYLKFILNVYTMVLSFYMMVMVMKFDLHFIT